MVQQATYQAIDRPYNNLLSRTPADINNINPQGANNLPPNTSAGSGSGVPGGYIDPTTGLSTSSNGLVETKPVKSSGALGDVWIDTFIASQNWKPKSIGFYIDGQTGYAEFTNVFVSGEIDAMTGIIGGFRIGTDYVKDIADTFGLSSNSTAGNDVRLWAGASFANRNTAPFRVYEDGSITATGLSVLKLDIPDTTAANSFHVDTSGNAWWGTNVATGHATAPAKILNTGAAAFTSISINGGVIDGTSTIGGRTASVLATAINSSGAFINANLDTSAKTILGSFTFSGSGAIQIGTYSAGVSGDIKISPTGILGRNSSNVTTFAIDATTGNATFGGTLASASGTFGTITSGTISGVTITGSTLSTSTSGQRTVLSSTIAEFYNSSDVVTAQLNANSNNFYVSGVQGNSNLVLSSGSSGVITLGASNGSTVIFNNSISSIYPVVNNTFDLGLSGNEWRNLYIRNYFYYLGYAQPVIMRGYVSGTTVSRSNTSFTVTNPSTGNYTITHNLSNSGYIVQLTALRASGSGAYIAKATALNTTTIDVTVFNDAGTAVNGDFMFSVEY